MRVKNQNKTRDAHLASSDVGRVRDEPALGGVKYVVLSHNTKLGAGKGAVLLAEWLTREGYIDRADGPRPA